MNYQVLARKWRPRSFSTLVGQTHVVRALSHALDSGRLHHAWLFTGTRGVGKTTIARILARALNCERGVSAEPCGQCEHCVAIESDRFPDYVEMDAASNRGVDDMASLLDRAVYAPVQGRYKVYMIDEVHMLTGHAFNAMLKTLEEPPEHVKFILATTDPQKIPVTVLSRCLQFNLKQMPASGIIEYLNGILEAEQVPFQAAALTHIAKAANGSMRDALSLLDQAIAHGAGRVESEQVAQMLGTVGEDYLHALLDALHEADVEAMLAVADQMQARALSFDDALQTLASWLHRIAVGQFAPSALPETDPRMQDYCSRFDAEFLQLAYQIVIHGREELPLAPDEYTGFTMTLLRLHAFRPASPKQRGEGRNDPGAPGRQRPPTPTRTAPLRGAAADEKVSVEAAGASPTAQLLGENAPPPWEDVPDEGEVSPREKAEAVRDDDRVAAQPMQSGAESVQAWMHCLSRGDWHEAQRLLRPGGMLRQLCQHCEWLAFDDGTLRLRLEQAQRHMLALHPDLGKRLEAFFVERGGACKVRIEVGEIAGQTPAQLGEQNRRRRHREAVAAVENDPFVREVVKRFDATFEKASVKPLSE